MIYQWIQEIENEVGDIIRQVLDNIAVRSFNGYVLLLANADCYAPNVDDTKPQYFIETKTDYHLEKTRMRFMEEYLNAFAGMARDNVYAADDVKEFSLNIQLMVYSQLWESHQFLRTLRRMARLLSNKPYEWNISFCTKNRKGELVDISKVQIIQDTILTPLQENHPEFYKLISYCYDRELRNDFAHATYYFDWYKGEIVSVKLGAIEGNRRVSFGDWEEQFVYSMMLSYQLYVQIREAKNRFRTQFPKCEYIEVPNPGYDKEKGNAKRVIIYPSEEREDREQRISFFWRTI